MRTDKPERNGARPSIADGPPPVQADAQQHGVAVQHLLEVRHPAARTADGGRPGRGRPAADRARSCGQGGAAPGRAEVARDGPPPTPPPRPRPGVPTGIHRKSWTARPALPEGIAAAFGSGIRRAFTTTRQFNGVTGPRPAAPRGPRRPGERPPCVTEPGTHGHPGHGPHGAAQPSQWLDQSGCGGRKPRKHADSRSCREIRSHPQGQAHGGRGSRSGRANRARPGGRIG